jgi:chromate reductase, NAD(P)H dehydrogenase (quinone)
MRQRPHRGVQGEGKTILGIPGSLRRGSYNGLLLNAAIECSPAGVVVTVFDELASIPLFDEDLERATGCGPEVVQRLRRRVASANGLLIATPEYNHSIPGVLKNAIDWLSRPAPEEPLAGKPVAVIGASGGRWGTRLAQAALRQVLFATESLVMPRPALFVRDAEGLFDEAGRLVDLPTREQLTAVLAAFARWIDVVGPGGVENASGSAYR